MAKILVVDDYQDSLDTTLLVLSHDQHEIITANNGDEALSKAHIENPDVILLDINLSSIDGFKVCEQLKSSTKTAAIPIIFLTAHFKDNASLAKGFSVGAEDYIVKPFVASELLARVKVMIRLKKQLEELAQKNLELAQLNQNLAEKNKELLEVQKTLQEIAIKDDLTQLYNRRYFSNQIKIEFSRALRNHQPIGLVMLDIDHFKAVNDNYGHPCGDSVLVQFANILQQNVRKYDIVARYGGEEFIIGLIGQDLDASYATGQRIRADVENFLFVHEDLSLRVTCSAGVVSYPEICPAPPNLEALIEEVDTALYEAKQQGRNRVISASPEEAHPS